MTLQGGISALIGLYLAASVLVSAGRRASGAPVGWAPWIALFGAWGLVIAPRWVPLSGFWAPVWGLVWLGLTLLLSAAGRRIGVRSGLGAWTWLLGPAQAVSLVATWLAASRRSRRRAVGDPAVVAAEPDREALESVVELGETTVGEIIVPRSEITALPRKARVRDWVHIVQQTGHRSIPIFEEDLDEIQGVLDLVDLFRRPPAGDAVRSHGREIRFVPESMRCDDLLRELIAQNERVAIVVDEFGGTAGLVTARDLVEILLGEIDRQNPFGGAIVRISDREYIADGHYRLDDFNEWSPVPLVEDDCETLAGFMLRRLGKVPLEGERVPHEALELEAAVATERRILKVRIWFAEPAPRTVEANRAHP